VDISMAQSLENLDCKVSFGVGDGKVLVAYKTFMQFKTMNTMCEDLDLSIDKLIDFPKIPCPCDSNNVPIQMSTIELEKFISLFEISIEHNDKTEEQLFAAIASSNTSFEEIKKFLILINYLDNQQFINSLCKYSAKLIRENNVKLF